MGTDEQHDNQTLQETVTHLAADLARLRSKTDTEYQHIQTQVRALEAHLSQLEEDVQHNADSYTEHVFGYLYALRVKSDAAYEMLRATLPAPADPLEQEIRRLETLAEGATGQTRTQIMRQVRVLKSRRATGH